MEDVVCVLDREQGGAKNLKAAGIALHSVLRVGQVLDYLVDRAEISADKRREIDDALKNPRVVDAGQSDAGTALIAAAAAATVGWSLEARGAQLEANAFNKKLLQIMRKKRSNLCVALDLADAKTVLEVSGARLPSRRPICPLSGGAPSSRMRVRH